MREETLYELETPYRQKFRIKGFRFGGGEKACAMVAAVRGNEVQQMYVCALLVKKLRKLEEQGAIASGNELLVVPCVNHFSMNVGSRFWAMDKTDINRMFPGYDQGETTQRIAAALFEAVQGYKYGIHFASFYLPGDFVPHVRIMNTGYQTASLGNLFGLPYVVMRKPEPIDTTTLNYNWQIWETNAFSVYTKETDEIDERSAQEAVAAVLRYLSRVGMLRYNCHSGYMWLTGFDVPSLATMYVYKPMHGYNLMQAIARVNRVFKDKEGGLIVDYVGIASALKAAMKEYTKRDQSRYGDMDIAKVAYPKFQEKLQVCKDLLHGFDFSGFIGGSPLMMAKLVTGGVNFVLNANAVKRKDLFLREALLLKQSHSLCSSMTTEQERHEAAYMEEVRSTVVKITYGGSGGKTLSLKEINAQINELLKASIQSQGVISLFDSKQADENISLFDPAVLDEISKMKEKNIAVEILKKLMAEQVSLYKRTNVVQSQKFSEKITQLMNSYYNGLITNEEVIKELLKTAQEITELYNNGKKLGLTQEELAFYDALTKPENIKDFYQNNELIDLTRELTEMLRKNRTIDWQKKETARASMRKMVKHLLKKYKYPPEDYDTAISMVISQCEMWTDNMVV